MFFLELVSASTPALVSLLQEGPYPKDECDLVLFDIITHSPGKSASGWQDPGNFRFAMSCAMKFQNFPLWDALGEASRGVKHPEELHTGRGAAQPRSLRKSQRLNSTWHAGL